MPFVKLDCNILTSTLWCERDAREIFLTALLLAEPRELSRPEKEIESNSLDYTGWEIPPGWYGFAPASGPGIVYLAKVDEKSGRLALERLAAPEPESRSQDFEGRRMVRIDGGFIILNYIKYRERDYTTAERSKRYRDRKASRRDITIRVGAVTEKSNVTRDITQAEAEGYAEADPDQKPPSGVQGGFPGFWKAYPRKVGKGAAEKAWGRLKPDADAVMAALAWQVSSRAWLKDNGQYIPHPSTYLNEKRWLDEQPEIGGFQSEESKRRAARATEREQRRLDAMVERAMKDPP